jgi:large subunit ribosomal protein L6
MIEADQLRKEIVIPEGVEIKVEGTQIVVKANKNEISKKLFYPTIAISVTEGKVVLEPKKFSKREKKIINTFTSHIQNMIEGVQNPFVYKVKICSSHFPMNVKVDGSNLVIKNYLGEKVPRKAAIREGVSVKVEGDMLVLTSINKEAAGQTAANMEKSTRITNRDRRIFQDGLWIVEKAGKVL